MMETAEKVTFDFKVEDLINKDALAKNVMQKLNEDVASSMVYQIRKIAEKKVMEILEPEIENLIKAEKQAILDGVISAMPELAKLISEKIVEKAAGNLSSYNSKHILEKLFT